MLRLHSLKGMRTGEICNQRISQQDKRNRLILESSNRKRNCFRNLVVTEEQSSSSCFWWNSSLKTQKLFQLVCYSTCSICNEYQLMLSQELEWRMETSSYFNRFKTIFRFPCLPCLLKKISFFDSLSGTMWKTL